MDLSNIEWGSIADWVSGLGSFAAVVVALYLSRESQRINLSVACGLRVIIGSGLRQDVVSITATNIGNRATVISNIGISVGLFRKRLAIVTMPRDHFSDGIPKSLGDGERGHWGVPLDESKTWLKDLCADFVRSDLDVHTLRFHIYPTNGGKTTVRPEKSMRKLLREVVKEQRAQQAAQRGVPTSGRSAR